MSYTYWGAVGGLAGVSDGLPTQYGLNDPRHNFELICKQLLLLEDHLVNPRRHCPDCIAKHFLSAEALADEAITLGGNPVFFDAIENFVRHWRSAYFAGRHPHVIARQVRRVRKYMCKEMLGY